MIFAQPGNIIGRRFVAVLRQRLADNAMQSLLN
jgi:hypothetical protein